MHIRPFLRKTVVTVHQNADLETARRQMAENRVAAVFVLDGRGQTLGLVTPRLLDAAEAEASRPLVRLHADGGGAVADIVQAPVRRVSVGKLCRDGVPALREADSVEHALALMAQSGRNHLPVLRDGRPVGYVARQDLRHIAARRLAAASAE